MEKLKKDGISVNSEMHSSLGKVFKSIEQMLDSKSIPLTYSITSNLNQLEQEWFSDAIDIVTHALTNAADHGYILPSEAKGFKADRAKLELEFQGSDRELTIVVKDDGFGIEEAFIEEQIQRQGFTPMAKQSRYDVLFESGISSAKSVSNTSGRGIGLRAIKSIVEERSGMATISPRKPRGTVLVATIPKDKPQNEGIPSSA